jgi:hypothetical protein
VRSRRAGRTVELGENGYLIGFTDAYDYPAEMPFGWRCGPVTDANAVVLTTRDTGPLLLTLELHDAPPPPQTSHDWEPAEEISLRLDLHTLHLATLEQGDILEARPPDEDALEVEPATDSGPWMRMRLYCQADDPEPGLGDHGERHLIQLWHAPHTHPLHPDITDEDRRQRAEYAAAMPEPVEEYTVSYPFTEPGEED